MRVIGLHNIKRNAIDLGGDIDLQIISPQDSFVQSRIKMPKIKSKLTSIERKIHQAAGNGNLKKLRKLMKSPQNFDINSKDEMDEETTALHKASSVGHLEVIKFLIEKGALVNVKEEGGMTPLMSTSKVEVMKCLIENGADIDVKSDQEFNLLHYATMSDERETVKFLLENGANVNEKSYQETNSLCIAVMKGHLHIVKLLLENGANVNEKYFDGMTALQFAIQNGHLDMVKHLIENGGANFNGIPLLEVAIKEGHHEIVEYLTQKKQELDNNEIPEEKFTNKAPCLICMAPRNGFFILYPCGHNSLCEGCCIKIKMQNNSNCPSCRVPIKDYIKTFFQAPEFQ